MGQINNLLISIMYGIEPYLKWSILAMISLGAIAIILLIYAFLYLKKAYLKHRQKIATKAQEKQGQKAPSWWERFKAFLLGVMEWIGLKKRVGMAAILGKANSFLETKIGGRGYAYKIPRYLLIGAQNAGKASLIESLDCRVLGAFPEGGEIEGSHLSCHFFDTGSLVRVPGEYFIQENAIDSHQRKWDELLSLLVHYRVQKPVDGVILTIPVDELTTIARLDRESLVRRARYVRSQLDVMQDKLGFTLPIYIVLTKADLIPGFEAFSKVLPPEKLKQMLGWSSSFSLGVEFTRQWIDFAFDDIGDSLLVDQLEVLLKDLPKEQAEEIMLLPENIQSIREPLKLYLHELFCKTDYHFNFFFRGFYFTGQVDSILDPVKGELLKGQKKANPVDKKVSFFEDLLFEKIFPEYRLALVAPRRLFSISRSTNLARAFLFLILFGWGLGMWYDYARLKKVSIALLDNLNRAYSLMQSQPNPQTVVFMSQGLPTVSSDSLVFSINTLKKTYAILSVVNGRPLSTVFLPTSWAKVVEDRFARCIGTIMNRLIFQPMYYSFIHKMRVLTTSAVEDLSAFNNESTLFAPLLTPEFLLLRGYVEVMTYYQNAIDAYYNLGFSHDIEHLNTLTAFLFNVAVPENLMKNKEFFSVAIKYGHPKSEVPVLDFVPEARKKLRTLYDNFMTTLFKNNPGVSLLQAAASDINIAGGDLVKVSEIRSVLKNMEFAMRNISLPSFQWIGDSAFNPGPAFDHIINLINTSSVFSAGVGMGDELAQLAAAQLPQLQTTLLNLRSDTTGPLLRISAKQVQAEPSQGYISLLKNLRLFLGQPFMQKVQGAETIKTNTPAGEYLMWNPKELDDITQHIAVYEAFLEQDMQKYPGVLHEHLLLLAQQLLNDHIVTAIARSQTFISAPQSLDSYSLEDAIRTQVSNFTKVMPVLKKTLQTLEVNNMTSTYLEIRNLLVGQVYKLLEMVDTFFESESFYEPLYGSYNWWQGQKNLDFQAYNVHNDFALKNYLTNQHERIIYLVSEFAQPLIEFLTLPFLHLEPAKVNLLSKWQLILDQTQAYQTKKPGNDILKLENYLQTEINQIDTANCAQTLKTYLSQSKFTGNWFSQKERALKQALYSQCQVLLKQDAAGGYSKLQQYFASNLAGQFPFTGGSLTNVDGEASPDALRGFFALYDQYAPAVQAYLEEQGAAGLHNTAQAKQFMTEMGAVRTFFSSFLDNPSPSALPSYKVRVKFRTNTPFEVGANQLLRWSFTSGGIVVTNQAKDPQTTWQFGLPVGASFQWVDGGPFSPAPSNEDPALVISDNTAELGSQSPWALLKFIMAYEAPAQYIAPMHDKSVHTLMFSVPSQSNYSAGSAKTMMNRFFIDLTLESITQTGPGQPLRLPYFPSQAPQFK